MGKKTTNSRVIIRDDILKDNHRAGRGRSRRDNRDRTTTQRTVRAERGPTVQEQAQRSDGPSGTHCTSPSVNAETVTAARRLTRSQGRPLGRPAADNKAPEEPLKLCQFYMRTGTCAYGDGCRHIHPPNVQPPTLSPLSYPLRKGVERCRFYMRNGFCGFGATCRFDHSMPSPEGTGQTLPPNFFGPTMNPGLPFSVPMYVSQMPVSSWYGPVPPPVSYAAYMATQQSFPFAGGYPQYPYVYPPVPMPLTEGWPKNSYLIGSPPLDLAIPPNSDETSELHEDVSKLESEYVSKLESEYVSKLESEDVSKLESEDVSKLESEDDSDDIGQIDRCWSN